MTAGLGRRKEETRERERERERESRGIYYKTSVTRNGESSLKGVHLSMFALSFEQRFGSNFDTSLCLLARSSTWHVKVAAPAIFRSKAAASVVTFLPICCGPIPMAMHLLDITSEFVISRTRFRISQESRVIVRLLDLDRPGKY